MNTPAQPLGAYSIAIFAVTSICAMALLSDRPAARSTQQGATSKELLAYFGTYTSDKSKGIYVSRLNLGTGALTPPEMVAETPNPSFLAVHPRGDVLYAANEVRTLNNVAGGAVSGFAIDRSSGRLTPINQQSSGGEGAVYVIVDKAGRNVLVSNYGGGSAAVLPIDDAGRLKEASAFVQHTAPAGAAANVRPRAHSINLDPANRFGYVADLGLDQVRIYRFDSAAGSLVPSEPPFVALDPGAGPRHFAFHPTAPIAYVINEKHVTVSAFTHSVQDGRLTPLQTITTLPQGEPVELGYSTAEVQVHPSGKFLYGSNRGHNSIAVFTIDPATGRLTFVEAKPTQGNTPRGFGIDPTGAYLLVAHQRSDSVVVFRIDQTTGRLKPTGHSITIGSPAAVKFVEPRP
jgi:6-phosphogluconolactonase